MSSSAHHLRAGTLRSRRPGREGSAGWSTELRAAWASGGFDGVRRWGGLSPEVAADLALRAGLATPTGALTVPRLLALADERRTSSAGLAARWDVAPGTVEQWRAAARLPCTLPATGAELAVGGPDPDAPIGAVDDRRTPLGRSTRRVLDRLVAAAPDAAPDDDLLHAGAAPGSLRATVSHLRRHLPPGAVVRVRGGYRLTVAVAPEGDT